MIIEEIKLRKMVSTDGFVLTNGETYEKKIYLGKNDKPENWHEITDEEYQEILKEQEEMLESMPEYEVQIQEDVLETEVQEDTLEQEVDIPEPEMGALEHMPKLDEELLEI